MPRRPHAGCWAQCKGFDDSIFRSRVSGAKVRSGSFASILPCPISRPLSTIPDTTTSDREPSACRLPCARSANNGARPPQLLRLASLDLATRDARAVTKDSAYKLRCREGTNLAFEGSRHGVGVFRNDREKHLRRLVGAMRALLPIADGSERRK
jgi:hypothetical protein